MTDTQDTVQAPADLFELADKLTALKARKDDLADQTKANNGAIREVEEALSEAMVDAELQRFTRGDRSFYLATKTFVSPQADRKDDLLRWLMDHGHGALVTNTVNTNTLAAFVREMLDDGTGEVADLPDGLADLVNVHRQPTVQVRKS